MTETPSLAPLYLALAAARDQCAVAEKSGKHHHGFAYAPSEEIFGVAREAFAGTGLTLLPLRSAITTGGAGVSEHGEALGAQRTLVRTFALVHASGAVLEVEACPWPIVGGKGRGSDTAVAIALTTQLAYLYRDLLLMRRGGDEHDSEDQRREPAARPALAPRQASAAPRPAPQQHDAQAMRRPTAEELAAAAPARAASSAVPAPGAAAAAAAHAAPAAAAQAPGPSGSNGAAKDSTLAAALPNGTQATRVLEAPAATPAAKTAEPTPISDRVDEDERVANKLGDEHWELAPPLCDGDLAQVVDRELAKSVLSIGTARLGGIAAALAAWGKTGVAPRAVPTRGQLRAFLLGLPDTLPVEA